MVGKASPEPAEYVRPTGAGRQLGKTFRMAVRGREVTVAVGRAVGKHPLPISPSRRRFALFRLCQPGRAREAESELVDAPSAPRPAPQDVP